MLRHAWPWLAAPVYVGWRAHERVTLDDYAPAGGSPAARPGVPLVRVVVPARDEARNIARCVSSILATTYPRLELVVVDDHSSDGTGALAAEAAAGDARCRVIVPDPLPPGWMGKQWACASGAAAFGATGDYILFADADTAQAPDLVGRMVTAAEERGSALLSVAGTQELGTAWEKLVQPQVFAVIAGRYGSAERVSNARRAVDKIANGQCLMMERRAYEAVGTHAAVRDVVVEDLKLAQRTHAHGLRVDLVRGEAQLRTRMYTSLGELVAGWRKNVFAGGREAMPLGWFGQLLFPLLLLFPSFAQLWPVARLLWAQFVPIAPAELLGMWIAVGATLLFWAAVYVRIRLSPLWALAFPAGALLYAVIAVQAIARGQRVEWRGREYRSAVRAA